MPDKSVRPEDVLPDDTDFVTFHGVRVRKGTIKAAMDNMEILKSGDPADHAAALAMIRELARGLVALGVHRHFICRNPEAEAILEQAARDLGL